MEDPDWVKGLEAEEFGWLRLASRGKNVVGGRRMAKGGFRGM